MRCSFLLPALVCVFAVLAHYAGLFDRPPFEYRENLMGDGKDLYAIVATSTEKDIGRHVERLLSGSRKAVDELPDGKAMLERAAATYGAPKGAEALGVGVYYDDPAKWERPRWAIGWAVEGPDDFGELQKLAASQQATSGLDSPLRAVRIGQNAILKAKIPWRFMATPMIAPMLHWGRGMQAYLDGGYKSTNGREGQEDASICLEMYVTGPGDSLEYIDYVVLMGDTSQTWDDVWPLSTATSDDDEVSRSTEGDADSEEETDEEMDEEGEDDEDDEDDEEEGEDEDKDEDTDEHVTQASE